MGANGGSFQRSPYEHDWVDPLLRKAGEVRSFADPMVLSEPATRADVDALRAEVRALRAELTLQSSVILTGRDVVDGMRELLARSR